MEKMKMQSENLANENVEKIAKLFPNCVTEGKDENGQVTKLVDFDLLKQELSKVVVDGNDERYTLNWAGKKQSILTANSPINATLRPYKEESVGKDGTNGGFDSENLYIEGDNLDVLKLLRETYLNKIKMIYIDPPYNTGNDFVYNDDFASSADEYLQNSKSYDEDGNRMVQNLESNGRFHSDWLSMMYPRLKLARDLLTDDGVIFISIDDREQENLKKICNEIFGESNCVGVGQWRRVEGKPGKAKTMARTSEFVLIYARDFSKFVIGTLPLSDDGLKEFRYSDNKGKFRRGQIYYPNRGIHNYSVTSPYGNVITGDFTIKEEVFNDYVSKDLIYWAEQGDHTPYLKIYLSEFEGVTPTNTFGKEYGSSQSAVKEFKNLFNTEKMYFDNPKPLKLIYRLLLIANLYKDSIVLDFFSGSATTAHAVMQLNAEDGGNKKFIMVQLPEKCDEKSEAYKAGYKNICEIGKERIRRAGKKIVEEIKNASITFGKNRKDVKEMSADERKSFDKAINMASEKLNQEDGLKNLEDFMNQADRTIPDIGFRVLKLDSSNMKDVYYSPSDTEQTNLLDLVSNIKEDRSPEDLLFQVMLDMGVMLSSEIRTLDIKGKKVFNVNDGNLVCCFDENLTDEVVTEIAKMQPLYAVFRDSSMSSDSVAVNFDQIFETYSPSTTRKVL